MNAKQPQHVDAADFVEIIERHKGIIYKVAKSYCHNAEDQKDLMQEIVIQLWRSRDKYDDSFALSTWIYRIALNVSISAFRKSSRRQNSASLNDAIELVAAPGQFSDSDEILQLHRFIGELKELDRALMLLYLDRKSHKDMANILGLTTTNVATKLARIKKTLKQKFAEGEQNE